MATDYERALAFARKYGTRSLGVLRQQRAGLTEEQAAALLAGWLEKSMHTPQQTWADDREERRGWLAR